MIPVLKYIILTLKHKWYVLLIGIKLKVSIFRLLKHDLSKFSHFELPHYGKQFFGKADDPQGFIKAWLHHQNSNDHHWEYWIPRTGHKRCNPPIEEMKPIQMSEQAVREMVADWIGAGKAYTKEWPNILNWTWFRNNINIMNLHPKTKLMVSSILKELIYFKGIK